MSRLSFSVLLSIGFVGPFSKAFAAIEQDWLGQRDSHTHLMDQFQKEGGPGAIVRCEFVVELLSC